MIKKLTRDKQNIFRLLLYSYLIVYCIPALIGIVWAVFSYNRISRNAEQYQMLMLQQVRYSCDNVLEQVRDSAALIATDPSVTALHSKTALTAEDQFYNRNLRDTLLHQNNTHAYYQECGVYFLRSESLVTNKRRYGSELDLAWFGKYGCTADEFLKKSGGLEGIFVLSDGSEDYLVVYRNVYNPAKERTAVSFVLSSVKNMRRILSDLDPDQRFNVYLSDGKSFKTWFTREDAASRRVLEETLTSHIPGLLYGIRVPRAAFYHDIDLAFGLLVSGLLILLIAGVAAIRHFTSSSYKPLAEISLLLDRWSAREKGDRNDSAGITYQDLTDSLEGLLADYQSQESQILHHEKTRQQELLAGFLRGSYPYTDWLDDFVAGNRQLCNLDSFQVLLITFDRLETCPLLTSGKDQPENSYKLLMFVIRNIVNELLLLDPEGGENGIILDMGGSIAGIIGCDETPAELRRKLTACVETLEGTLQIRALCTVSAAHSKWEELSTAYDEALLKAGTNQYLSGRWGQVLFYSDSMTDAPVQKQDEEEPQSYQSASQIVLLERKLINAVAARDHAGAREALTQSCSGFIRDIEYRDYNRSLSVMLLHIISDAAARSNGLHEQSGYSWEEDLQMTERKLSAASSIREMESLLLGFLDRVLPERKLSENAVPEWVGQMKDYIEENYSDQNLNVSYLSEHFSLSSTHTGSQFRFYTGMTILSYIHMVRIRAAKKALDRSATLKEAAQEAGFSDVKSFIRIFKQYEGMTPGQYKER